MAGRLRLAWLPRFLFWSSLFAAVVLVALVFLAPPLDNAVRPAGWRKLVALFARDVAVRRTAVASAVGLAVTAFVFFKSPRPRPGTLPQPRLPPPTDVVGA
ncbi:MAG TPA: hypothetical protein VG013_29140 [Gemmataceae bacterium]|jgi:hypothetical protein|nr:hypothetical protein [Gemmataceae bacterium]